MYSNTKYFIFGFGVIWVIMKLEHILGLPTKRKFAECDFFLFFMGKQSNYDNK